jgi:gliding motility-associated-like protein
MNKVLPYSKVLFAMITLFLSLPLFAQLPNFTLDVTATGQTCLGNGSLSFTVTGNNALASMDYAVYLLPDTTTPLVITTNTTVGGLVAGTYTVVATQSLAGESNTSSDTVTITNNVVPLLYNLSAGNVRCGNDGTITVNTTSGTAVSYEIMSGPETAPLQASNIFTGLPVGLYQVRVYDNCGEAVVVSIQIVQGTTSLNIGAPAFLGGELPSCDTIYVSNTFFTNPGDQVFWPLEVTYTIFPPGGGAATTIELTVPAGPLPGLLETLFPFYYDQEYTYNLKIVDACGNVYQRNNNVVNEHLFIGDTQTVENCGDNFFELIPGNYVPPYTLEFVTAPAGFDPVFFNASHPVFDEASAIYGGAPNYVPEGSYTVKITDACGRSSTHDFVVEDPEINPEVASNAEGCEGTGSIHIEIPGRTIDSIILTEAPDAYPEPLPQDVTGFVTEEGFDMENLPLGSYKFTITDSCGDEYTVETEIEPAVTDPSINVSQHAGCAVGEGSVKVSNPDSEPVVTITITAAPTGFTETLPYDGTAYIDTNGSFYMNSLPAGVYTFVTTNSCGAVRTQNYTVQGYNTTINEYEVIPHCGSFDLLLHHISNGNFVAGFWLQRYNEADDVWEHPVSGTDYTGGAANINNSVILTNNTTNINLAYTGHFRVLKTFMVYSNGSAANFRCVEVLEEFDFDGGPVITDAYSFPCANGLTEVAVVAEGLAPLTYSITSKNGEPFLVENEESNLFSGLEAATYNFQVTDVCGNIRNIQFDIDALDPIAIVAQGFCENEDSSLAVQEFSFLNYEWYEAGSPGTILSTTGTLAFPDFDSAADAGTYIVSITSSNPNSCVGQELEYTVGANVLPDAGDDVVTAVCNEGAIVDLDTLLATPHDLGGAWEDMDATGALNGGLLSTGEVAAGTYQFKYTVTGLCDLSDEAMLTIELKDIPLPPTVTTPDEVCEGTDVQLAATTVVNAAYHWTGPNGFESFEQNPLIQAAGMAANGIYSLNITINGCTSAGVNVPVTVKAIPQFTIEGGTVICDGQLSLLWVTPVAPGNFDLADATYKWYHDGVLLPDETLDVEAGELGVYKVEVNNNGCTNSLEVLVTPNENPFTVELEAGCVNFDYVIRIINLAEIPDAEFEWSGPGNFSSTASEVVITDMAEGDYAVSVTSIEGCTVNAAITVDNTSCMIPRGISPNGDGKNDTFDLSNLDVKEVKIFNRYGLEVFHGNEYVDEWHGQSDKGDLPTGTYYYVVTLSAGKQVTGWVYLQREIK